MIQVAYGILWAVTILLVTIIGRWWKAHKDEENVQSAFAELKDWAEIAVRAAKDLGDSKLEMTGSEKAEYAFIVLKDVRDKLGLDLTDEQLMLLVRHAYTVMVDESAEPVYLVEGKEDGE